jgi:hypothetical protein
MWVKISRPCGARNDKKEGFEMTKKKRRIWVFSLGWFYSIFASAKEMNQYGINQFAGCEPGVWRAVIAGKNKFTG